MDTYGQRLDAALAKKGGDRAWLAKQIGISVQALSQLILGKTRSLTAENHEVAAAVLGCSGSWLATGHGEMTPQANPALHLASSGATPATLGQTLQSLSSYFDQMDASTRSIAVSLLGQLADNPADHARIAAMIELSIASKVQKRA